MLDFLKKLLNPGMSTSGKFKLDFTDFIKLSRTGLFVGAGATITYILANIGGVDFDGPNTETGINAIMIMVFTMGFEAIQKYLASHQEEKLAVVAELKKDLKEDSAKFAEEIKELKTK